MPREMRKHATFSPLPASHSLWLAAPAAGAAARPTPRRRRRRWCCCAVCGAGAGGRWRWRRRCGWSRRSLPGRDGKKKEKKNPAKPIARGAGVLGESLPLARMKPQGRASPSSAGKSPRGPATGGGLPCAQHRAAAGRRFGAGGGRAPANGGARRRRAGWPPHASPRRRAAVRGLALAQEGGPTLRGPYGTTGAMATGTGAAVLPSR